MAVVQGRHKHTHKCATRRSHSGHPYWITLSLEDAIRQHFQGTSIRKCAKMFGVPEPTLRSYVSPTGAMYGRAPGNLRYETILSAHEERRFLKII
jgi:hypothetical protein